MNIATLGAMEEADTGRWERVEGFCHWVPGSSALGLEEVGDHTALAVGRGIEGCDEQIAWSHDRMEKGRLVE